MNIEKKSFQEIINYTEENLEKLLNKEGRINGEVFHTQLEYIKKKKGEKGLDDFREKSVEMGKEIDLRNMDFKKWYPVGLRAFSFAVMIKAFEGWGREELMECGYQAPKTSFVLKLALRYFISFEDVLKKAPQLWRNHYDIGSLSVFRIDSEKKEAIIRIENFDISPLFCIFYLGYFQRVCELGGGNNISVEKIRCIHEGDSFHEYLVRWN